MVFRVPCDPGDPWAAVLDANGASRLAKVLRSATTSKKKKSGAAESVDIERSATSLVVSVGGQRVTLHAGDVQDEEPGPVDGEARVLDGVGDLVSRIARAMTFCAPAGSRDLTRGPHLYLRAAGTCRIPVIVSTDGHRMFMDGEVGDCAEATTVLRVPGDNWRSAVRALDTTFDRIRVVRSAIVGSVDKHLDYLVFESTDREVRILLETPQVRLPGWSGYIPPDSIPAAFDVTCNKADLVRGIKAIPQKNGSSEGRVAIAQAAHSLNLQAGTADDLIEQSLNAEVAGAQGTGVTLAPRYVLDALAVVGTERVRIRQVAALDPVRFLEVGVSETWTTRRLSGIIVMPVFNPRD